MSSNLNGVVLDAPAQDPNIAVSESFTMTIYGTYAGGGSASSHDLIFEWDQGSSSWTTIPISSQSSGLWTDGDPWIA